MMNSPVTIDDLPTEMLCELFKHLNPRNLVACSLVNKRWNSAYSTFRVRRLVACAFRWSRDRWYDSRKFEERDFCHLERFHRLIDKPLLSNLQHLALCRHYWYRDSPIDLNKLNVFRQLIRLEIETDLGSEKVSLHLPKLKILAIHLYREEGILSIDCPELSTFLHWGANHSNLLEVKHPETIRRLDTAVMCPDQMAQFKNVEYLVVYRRDLINKDTLVSLPSLKELHCYYCFGRDEFSRFLENGTFEKRTEPLRKFLDDLEMLRDSDFRVTLAGLPLTKWLLNPVEFGVRIEEGRETLYEESVYLKNCHLFDPNVPDLASRTVDYVRLMKLVVGEIPAAFFQNITGIRTVEITKEVASESHFLWFLKSLNSLEELSLNCTKLSQTFFDQLPASIRLPLSLNLKCGSTDREIERSLNFDFLEKLPRLTSLYIGVKLSFASLTSLIISLNKLEPGSFQFDSYDICPSVKRSDYF